MARTLLNTAIAEQNSWIEKCGGDLTGYIAKYGTPGEERCLGEGGEAIYTADLLELRRLETLANKRKYL